MSFRGHIDSHTRMTSPQRGIYDQSFIMMTAILYFEQRHAFTGSWLKEERKGLKPPVIQVVPMDGTKRKGYAWAIAAGLNAALAAIAAKFFSSQVLKYGMVVLVNVTMWVCYVNSLKALSSLQATVTNFATNFLSSGLAGFFLFEETLSVKWFAGASLIVFGVLILNKSSVEQKVRTD